MDTECSRLHQQNERLQSVVQQLEVEVTELKADAEIRDNALESLQEAMGKIERSADFGHARATSPLSGTPPGIVSGPCTTCHAHVF